MTGGLVRTAARGGVVRRRLGGWLLVAVLAAGCTTSDATQRPGSDHTDVWFAQHMVPHLLQNSAILDLAGEQLTRPKLPTPVLDTLRRRQAHQPAPGSRVPTRQPPMPPPTPTSVRKRSDEGGLAVGGGV